MENFVEIGLIMRATYWNHYGDPQRAAAEPTSAEREEWAERAARALGFYDAAPPE